MCGRYTQTLNIKKLMERFGLRSVADEVQARFNIAPSQQAPVVIRDGEQRQLKMMEWGLIPFWIKELAEVKSRPINARGETVHEKPTFRRAFQSRRCLVLADSFYEWKKIAGQKKKQPMRVTLEGNAPFAMAGLYEIYHPDAGDEISSFTIVTTTANDKLKPIHDRMPVILQKKDERFWLDPESPQDRLKELLVPYPQKDIRFYPVSEHVNSPRHDDPTCIEEMK